MAHNAIIIKGAREHNLKNIDVTIPRDRLVVITGVSGSGKSTLAFDTIFAEGQRRYVESLSAYARQFLGQMEKPDVDYIEGLSPAISIDQNGSTRNPRSTVGTVTEIYDYLRLLFARVGHPHCPECGREIARQTVQQITDAILKLTPGTRLSIMAPLIKDRKGEHHSVFDNLRREGYVRVRVDNKVHDLTDDIELDKNKKHTIDAVIDRIIVNGEEEQGRITDSVETALKLGNGVMLVITGDNNELLFSEHFACVHCGINLGEIEPRTFSFNNPHGACPACGGLGIKLEIDPELAIPDKNLSLSEGAIHPWGLQPWHMESLERLARQYNFSMNIPVRELSQEQTNLILYGEAGELKKYRNRFGRIREYFTGYEGVVPYLERIYKETESDYRRNDIERYMSSNPCSICQGKRLKPEPLSVTIDNKNIMDVSLMIISETRDWIEHISDDKTPNPVLTQREMKIAAQILKELKARIGFLVDVGLDYLTLDRSAKTLSGGEAQRIHLATQIGSGLMGVLYICDEPTVGLHFADNARLIETLTRLRDIGNTVLVVEHDESIMRVADYIIDIGPGPGKHGGEVVAYGTLQDIMNCHQSITGQYLSGAKKIPVPSERRRGSGKELVIKGARQNNLKNIDVHIPLGMLVCFTGVSGSGKSSLINDVLYRKISHVFYRTKDKPGDCDGIMGLENIDKVINIDQSPIGRTPRSNPATYTGAFTPIREIFSRVPEAQIRGYTPGRFSFNVKGGRCETCQGAGFVQIEMQFLPDVTVPCDVCRGKRYNREALEIYFKGKNIADVLEMSVEEALLFFENIPRIKTKLESLRDVGLGYIQLGQAATTLSGGEAQRIKLATELSRRATGNTLYILDEPTTGLSFPDIEALLKVLQRLVDAGNSVIIVEHHPDVIKNADYIIDLGPGAGEKGGYIVASGTPEQIAETEASVTGRYLINILGSPLCEKNS